MGTNGSGLGAFLPLLLLILLMYFLMIRPQRKKDKEVKNMRDSLSVGDEIITIGGLRGKIVKTKDDSIVLQVGTEKIKMEFMKWAVSSVEKKSAKAQKAEAEAKEEEPAKKAMPKRLKKTEEAPVEEAPKAEELPKEVVEEAPKAEEVQEEKVEETK